MIILNQVLTFTLTWDNVPILRDVYLKFGEHKYIESILKVIVKYTFYTTLQTFLDFQNLY